MEFSMKLRKITTKQRYSSSVHFATTRQMKKRRKLLNNSSNTKKCVCDIASSSSSSTGSMEFPPVWAELRLQKQLCDGVVKCEDGIEFNIHRAILSAVSPYFKALFTNSINRNQPETTEANVNVPSDIFNSLLDFAYTGTCTINDDNVENLLQFADQYEVLGVVQLCCKHLIEQLCPSNCLGILNFARQYFCSRLIQRGNIYVRHHFNEVLKESDEFLQLSIEDLVDLLKDDQLNVKSEDIIFEASKLWINHDPEKRKRHLLKLLKCVRLGNLPDESLSAMLCNPLVEEDEKATQFLIEAKALLADLEQEDIDIANNYIFRPRIPYDVLFAIGGWSAGSPTNFVETYDVRADRWLLSMDTDSVPRAYHGLCALKGLIYMIGGFDGNEYFNNVRCFDPLIHMWNECACMYYPRCYVSVVINEDKIYAMGGYNGRVRMNSVERFDPEKNQWEILPPMQRQRSDASAATLKNKIYIVGGFNGQEVMCSAEMFDPSTNQWTYIPSMHSARSGVSLVAYKNALYAFGGFNGYTRLTSGEKWLPDGTTSWAEISDMMTPRSNFATAILDGFIYAIGGFNGSSTISYVEYYDPEINEWFDASSMNLNRSALSACVISGLPNAKDYSFLGKNNDQNGQGGGADA